MDNSFIESIDGDHLDSPPTDTHTKVSKQNERNLRTALIVNRAVNKADTSIYGKALYGNTWAIRKCLLGKRTIKWLWHKWRRSRWALYRITDDWSAAVFSGSKRC